MDAIVKKLNTATMPSAPASGVQFDAVIEARSGHGLQKSAEAWIERGGAPASRWELWSDEGTHIGGKDEAPPPLIYLAAGIAFCLMTQITRTAEALKIPVGEVRFRQRVRFYREGSVLAGSVVSGARSIEVAVSIDSEAPPEQIQRLMRTAKASCFAHGMISESVAVDISVRLNDQVLA